jgi:hypothetical protein
MQNQRFKIFNVCGSRLAAGKSTCISGAINSALRSGAAFRFEFRLLLLDDVAGGVTVLRGAWVT